MADSLLAQRTQADLNFLKKKKKKANPLTYLVKRLIFWVYGFHDHPKVRLTGQWELPGVLFIGHKAMRWLFLPGQEVNLHSINFAEFLCYK